MSISTIILKGSFMAEILIAELIFLYSAEKRPGFPFRYIAAFIIGILIAILNPLSYSSLFSQFILFLSVFDEHL